MILRKTITFVLSLMVGLLMLSGCVEEYEADISTEDSNLLVIEGTICSAKLNKIILSHTIAINSTAKPKMEKNASVSVRGSDGSEYKMQNNKNGYYTYQMGELNPDVDYYLHIECDGEVYESEPQKPLRTEKIADVRGIQTTSESNIDVLVTPVDPFETDKVNYYSWTYDETWLVYPDFKTSIYYDMELNAPVKKLNQFPDFGWKDATSSVAIVGTSTGYDNNHIQNLKMYEIDCSNERLYHRYSCLVHQRAISKAEYEYELARRQASEEMGGLFTPLPSALPTNIRCLTSQKHVIGYVGCALNTSEYRFFLDSKDFSIYRPSIKDLRTWVENPTTDVCRRMVRNGYYLCEWEDPFKSPDGVLRTAWATEKLLDVRSDGAYIEEPDFWSLDGNVSY